MVNFCRSKIQFFSRPQKTPVRETLHEIISLKFYLSEQKFDRYISGLKNRHILIEIGLILKNPFLAVLTRIISVFEIAFAILMKKRF